mmetsp:Transcript_1205/g.2179  ORF Transcript_1205/g.2179 Transcript_1205/m.2179 type:complete len:262 (+) Transcript_1205:3-788(+)
MGQPHVTGQRPDLPDYPGGASPMANASLLANSSFGHASLQSDKDEKETTNPNLLLDGTKSGRERAGSQQQIAGGMSTPPRSSNKPAPSGELPEVPSISRVTSLPAITPSPRQHEVDATSSTRHEASPIKSPSTARVLFSTSKDAVDRHAARARRRDEMKPWEVWARTRGTGYASTATRCPQHLGEDFGQTIQGTKAIRASPSNTASVPKLSRGSSHKKRLTAFNTSPRPAALSPANSLRTSPCKLGGRSAAPKSSGSNRIS